MEKETEVRNDGPRAYCAKCISFKDCEPFTTCPDCGSQLEPPEGDWGG
jgi:rRNA maturation endonuclease Nob1